MRLCTSTVTLYLIEKFFNFARRIVVYFFRIEAMEKATDNV